MRARPQRSLFLMVSGTSIIVCFVVLQKWKSRLREINQLKYPAGQQETDLNEEAPSLIWYKWILLVDLSVAFVNTAKEKGSAILSLACYFGTNKAEWP